MWVIDLRRAKLLSLPFLERIAVMTNFSTPVEAPFAGLKPALVWAHFETLCRIPRPSKQEATLCAYLQAWAQEKGLECVVDQVGNLIIRKLASAGREHLPGVILQAHLDMVCQKNSGTEHDFLRDPIRPVVRDGVMLAEETTLGADNGIGVALALAALEDNTLAHGPLEALLTIDEEDGMGGALGLTEGMLHGKYVINLDTEAWGEFYLGCAGGMDIYVDRTADDESFPAWWQALQIDVSGLRGGHSGINIHEGRGNAIKILCRILCALDAHFSLRLASFVGGTARNALPREASAVVVVRPENMPAINEVLGEWQKLLSGELGGVDDAVRIDCVPTSAERVMSFGEQRIWLGSLNAAPHGVRRMCADMPDVVETSINLGMVDLQPEAASCNFMARSTLDSACNAVAEEVKSLFSLSGTAVTTDGYYPGWAPEPDSALLALCQKVYRAEFGAVAATQVIHAGLECGIIKSKYPDVEIISFGPSIHNPHAPGESVEIDTVAKCWQLLKAILAAVK